MKITMENLRIRDNLIVDKISFENVDIEKISEIIDKIANSCCATITTVEASAPITTNEAEAKASPKVEEKTKSLEESWDELVEKLPDCFKEENLTKYVYKYKIGEDKEDRVEIQLANDNYTVCFNNDWVNIYVYPTTGKTHCGKMPKSMYAKYIDSQAIPENVKAFIKSIVIK